MSLDGSNSMVEIESKKRAMFVVRRKKRSKLN